MCKMFTQRSLVTSSLPTEAFSLPSLVNQTYFQFQIQIPCPFGWHTHTDTKYMQLKVLQRKTHVLLATRTRRTTHFTMTQKKHLQLYIPRVYIYQSSATHTKEATQPTLAEGMNDLNICPSHVCMSSDCRQRGYPSHHDEHEQLRVHIQQSNSTTQECTHENTLIEQQYR